MGVSDRVQLSNPPCWGQRGQHCLRSVGGAIGPCSAPLARYIRQHKPSIQADRDNLNQLPITMRPRSEKPQNSRSKMRNPAAVSCVRRVVRDGHGPSDRRAKVDRDQAKRRVHPARVCAMKATDPVPPNRGKIGRDPSKAYLLYRKELEKAYATNSASPRPKRQIHEHGQTTTGHTDVSSPNLPMNLLRSNHSKANGGHTARIVGPPGERPDAAGPAVRWDGIAGQVICRGAGGAALIRRVRSACLGPWSRSMTRLSVPWTAKTYSLTLPGRWPPIRLTGRPRGATCADIVAALDRIQSSSGFSHVRGPPVASIARLRSGFAFRNSRGRANCAGGASCSIVSCASPLVAASSWLIGRRAALNGRSFSETAPSSDPSDEVRFGRSNENVAALLRFRPASPGTSCRS